MTLVTWCGPLQPDTRGHLRRPGDGSTVAPAVPQPCTVRTRTGELMS
jgi:hypothetical protein